MKKQIILFVLFSFILASCGNSGKKNVTSKTENTVSGEKVEFAALVANPDNYVGKNISVDGKVVHVCTETGKKMFIVGDNPDVRLFVAAGENISKFPMELLGSEITVEGTITKVQAQPEGIKEKDMKEGEMKMGKDSCSTETALAAQTSMSDIRMMYKSHIVR
jgi:starvation-inducible outer membrane lipoprotein